MTLKITITMDNAAFGNGDAGAEAAGILNTLASKLAGEGYLDAGAEWPLMDTNGNKVGIAKVVK